MNKEHKIGYINSFDSSTLNNINELYVNHNLVSNDNNIVHSTKQSFDPCEPYNLKVGSTVGTVIGGMISSTEDIHVDTMYKGEIIKPHIIGDGTPNINPFYSSQFSYEHPNGIDIYGCYFTSTKPGLYHYSKVTQQIVQMYDDCWAWSNFFIDSKGFVYCSIWSRNYSNKGTYGFFVITPDHTLHQLISNGTGYVAYKETSTGLYVSSGNSGGTTNILYVNNYLDIPTATVIGSMSYAALLQSGDRVFACTDNKSHLLYLTETGSTIMCESIGTLSCFGNDISNCTLPNGDFLVSSYRASKGFYSISTDLTETYVTTTGKQWKFLNITPIYTLAFCSGLNKLLVLYNSEIITELTGYSFTDLSKHYINGDYIYIWSSSGLFVFYDNTITRVSDRKIESNKNDVSYKESPQGLKYFITKEAVYLVDHLTFTAICTPYGYATLYSYYTNSHQIICSASTIGYSSGFSGIIVLTEGVSKRYINRSCAWSNIFEDSKNNVYISSTVTTRASASSSGYDSPSEPITGLWLFKDNTCTRIYDGYNWCYYYETNNSDVYLSSKVSAYGILKVDGANVKRIWDKSVSFQYVQETPNGLLVADTEFIGPDDKILYIKGDRVMETSINEINAYNKEANNE